MIREHAFERIMALLNEAMLDDARWPEASALIDEAFGAKGNVLTLGDEPTKGDVRVFFTKCYYRGTDRSAWQREYFREYLAEDEQRPRLRALPEGKIVAIADLFSEEELKRSRMYNEALPRFDSQNGLTVRLQGPYDAHIVWWIADPINGHSWSSSVIDMIGRVLPHIGQYVRVRTALADAEVLGTSVAELLDHTRAGVIQLDGWGRIVEANDCAAELFRRNDGLSDRGGVLRAVATKDNDRLQELLARALPRFDGPGASGSMIVRCSPLHPSFALHVKPVALREVDYRSRHVAALVLIADPVHQAKINPDVVQAALGLTPAETEIALLLADGRTARQIAATTGRRYTTVRTHLQRIFFKLGVSQQFEVAQCVLALSSLPQSRD